MSNSLEEKINYQGKLVEGGKFNEALTLSQELNRDYPDDIRVLNNMALAYKNLGHTNEARNIFLKIIEMDHDPKLSAVYSNAGSLLFNLGETKKSIEANKIAIKFNEKDHNALNNMGLAFSELGDLDNAIDSYKRSLEINPKHDATNYNLANIYRITRNYKEAIKLYDFTKERLSKSNQLECIYKDNNKELFNKKLKSLIDNDQLQPLIASLSSHAAIRYNQEDNYPFCPNPIDFICKFELYQDDRFNDQFLFNLANEINNAQIDKKSQSLLKNGFQSSGNIFLQNLPNVKILQAIVQDHIEKYYNNFAEKDDFFIKSWPKNYQLIGWVVIMQNSGSLLPHMHKEGWVSGSLYLNIPEKRSNNEGNIKFSLDGGDYPNDGKNYPEKIVDIKRGDLVMFPSSLFHSTIPFESEENRISFAFDLMPKLKKI
tara:strand:+ start:2129 stop:3415 length:1287 start_codon:yes stop_codon:yes gene_type:complete